MDSTLGNVTRLPLANIGTSKKSNSSKTKVDQNQQKIDFAKAVILGMADLIQGQRQFADEFGLPLNRVFPNSYKALYGHRAKDFVSILFETGSQNVNEIKNLFDDLTMHQVALFSSLDGIAEEGLKQLTPEIIQSTGKGKVRDSHAWRIFKIYHEELASNPCLRFEKVISNGLVAKYIRARQLNKKRIKR